MISPCLGAHEAHPKTTLYGVVLQKLNGPLLTSAPQSPLEVFAPTPEFPEIAEAQVLLAALVETDEVKTAATARQRRLKLQTDYGDDVVQGLRCRRNEGRVRAFERVAKESQLELEH
jgi:hypothetical protein